MPPGGSGAGAGGGSGAGGASGQSGNGGGATGAAGQSGNGGGTTGEAGRAGGSSGAAGQTPLVGTGRTSSLKHVTVSGAGAKPDVASGMMANCDGTGSVNAQPCLQAALRAAAVANKPLLIPATAAFYRIDAPLQVATSVMGVMGRPTIKQTTASGTSTGNVFQLGKDVRAWLSNLRLVGTHPPGGGGTGEHGHNIALNGVNGVTIADNLLENPQGDNIYGSGNSRNVLIANNTMKNPRRCGVAMIYVDSWAIRDNVIDKQVNYVSGVDFEPNADPDTTNRVEVGYNKFIMNNRTRGQYGSDGRAISAWQNNKVTRPGSSLFMHHNYGTFGVGWWMTSSSYKGGDGDWTQIVQEKNEEGSAPLP